MNRDDIKKILLSFKKEVEDLHLHLHELFNKIDGIQHVKYTHGPDEKGADFILTEVNAIGGIDYIGVIVKNGNVTKKSIRDINEQIQECEKMKRPVENGKREAFMNKVWIVVNETISYNAKEKIEAEQALGVHYIDIEDIIDLIQKYNYPIDGEISSKISICLGKQFNEADKISHQSIGYINNISEISIDRKIEKIENITYKRQRKKHSDLLTSPEKAVSSNDVVYIYGEPGSGKTDILLKLLKRYASIEQYKKTKAIPIYISAKDIVEKYGGDPCVYIDKFKTRHQLDMDVSYICIIDNAEECATTEDERIEVIKKWRKNLYPEKVSKIIFASRELINSKELTAAKYKIAALSMSEVVRVIRDQLKELDTVDKIIKDLSASLIFKPLSRSPVATILLIKLLKSTDRAYIPSTLPDLYEKYAEISLGRLDTSVERGMEQMKLEFATAIIANIAKYMMENKLYQINEEEAKDYFREYLSRRKLGLNPDDLFREIVSRADLLLVDSGTFRFRHRTVQEFFYAKQLSDEIVEEYGEDIFHPNIINSIYFYVGKKKDCHGLINKISAITPSHDATMLIKLINMSNILLAGYTTEYEYIKRAVEKTIIDAAEYIENVIAGEKPQSTFAKLSVMHCLWIVRIIVDDAYSYPFFSEAIEDILINVEDNKNISDNVKATALFLTYIVHRNLEGEDIFADMIDGKKFDLPIHIKLAIDHETDYIKSINPDIKRYKRAIEKNLKKRINISYLYNKKIIDIPKIKE